MSQNIASVDVIELIRDLRNRIEQLETRGELPLATIVSSASASAIPNNWLLCDGTAVSRTTYADLFSLIGTTYGAGDGSTTFNLPDMQGRVPVGADPAQKVVNGAPGVGIKGGEAYHQLSIAELPSHDHSISDPGHNHAPGTGADWFWTKANAGGNVIAGGATYQADNGVRSTTGDSYTGITLNPTGSDSAHNNMQPFLSVNFYIVAL